MGCSARKGWAKRARRHALRVPVGWERAGVVDGVVGLEALKLLARRPDQHVAHEERVVGARADDPHADPVLFVPSRVAVHDVDAVPRVEVVDRAFAVDLPHLWSHGLVDGPPPDVVLGAGLLDHALVQRRPARLGSRVGSQRARGRDGRTGLINQGIFVQGGDGWVGDDGNAIVVDVCLLVQQLLELCVLAVRLDTAGMQGGLVDVANDHFA
jgi:hypothetical protein